MDGFLNILKPPGMTSHDVVSYIRRIMGIKKIGHTGTLDPSAAGVLPICVGKATKAADYITNGIKRYRAELKLGVITNTGDRDGEVTVNNKWYPVEDVHKFHQDIKIILQKFKGNVSQTPPMFSAIKVGGVKLYEYARKGVEIQRSARIIHIFDIKLLDFSNDDGTLLIDVTCSKGTYIRVLCEDIGTAIGCGAYMSYLVRTESAGFKIDDSLLLEDVEEISRNNQLMKRVIPIDNAFTQFKCLSLDDQSQIRLLLNGARIKVHDFNNDLSDEKHVRIYIENNFIGLADIEKDGTSLAIKVSKFFY